MACRGARGESGKPPDPAGPGLGDIGIAFIPRAGARGIGEFIGRSPGLGLIGRPGLMSDGAVLLFGSLPAASERARCLIIARGSCSAWYVVSLVLRACSSGSAAVAGSARAIATASGGSSGASTGGTLLLFFSFFDWLLCSSSCRTRASRSRSSSSRVLRLPRKLCSIRALSGSSSYSESESSICVTSAGAVSCSGFAGEAKLSGAGGAFLEA